MIQEPSKRCRTCREIKPVGEFYRRSGWRPGHMPHCKKCHIIHVQENRRRVK